MIPEQRPDAPTLARRRPAPAPLLPLALGLIGGIAADDWWPLSLWVCGLVVLAGGAILAFGRRGAAATFLAVFLAGAGLGALRHAVAERRIRDGHIVTCTDARDEPIIATVTGRVIADPIIVEPDPHIPRAYSHGPKTKFLIEATEVAGVDGPTAVSGIVQVAIKEPLLLLRGGDLVRMTGWLYRPGPPQNPGGYDWAARARRSGVLVGLSCDHREAVIVLKHDESAGWRGVVDRLRRRLRGYLTDRAFGGDDQSAGVVAAMVLGQRSAVARPMNEAFLRTGNIHFLAASGMHVAWLALLGWGLCRIAGINYRVAAALVGALILTYVLLAEPRPSILRAGIIGVLVCAAAFVGGRYASVNALACAAIVILLINPTDLRSPAFLFSFLATIGLLFFCPRVCGLIATGLLKREQDRLSRRRILLARLFSTGVFPVNLVDVKRDDPSLLPSIGRKLAGFSVQLLVLSISEWIITAPLACYLFNRFVPLGWLGTFILAPFAMLTTSVGFLTILLGLVFPSSGVVMGPLLGGAAHLMIRCVAWLGQLPGGLVNGRSPSLAWLLAAYTLILLWTIRQSGCGQIGAVEVASKTLRRLIRWGRAWSRPALRAGMVVVVAWWVAAPYWARRPSGALKVWMLAVGDGTGTVIELPDRTVLLCDLGTRSPFDAGRVAVNFLQRRGIGHVDTIFVSHPDFDHYGGIETLAGSISIGRMVINDQFERFVKDKPAALRFLQVMRRRGIRIEVTSGPQRFDGGGVTIESLWPPAAKNRMAPDDNDSSTVLRIAYAGRSILLTGDISEWGIGGLLSRGGLEADVLALPHHGSVVHNTAAFISAVDPAITVRSSGQRQAMTTNGIEGAVGERRYLNTADIGCVRVTIDDGEVRVRTMREGF